MTTTNLDGFLGKLEVTNEIGEVLDKQLQQAEDQAQQLFGGCAALKMGASQIGKLGEHVDKDLDEGRLQFSTELEAAAYVKSYLRKAGEVLRNLADKSKSEELVAHGKGAAVRESMALVGRHCKAAKARAEQLMAAAVEIQARADGKKPESPEEGPRGGPRMPGERPGPSTLDERRAEAAAERAKKASESSQAEIPLSAEPAPEPSVKKVKKKAKAKKKTTKKKTSRKASVAGASVQG